MVVGRVSDFPLDPEGQPQDETLASGASGIDKTCWNKMRLDAHIVTQWGEATDG